MEPLERRVVMSATAATVALDPSFGQSGYAQPTTLVQGIWNCAGIRLHHPRFRRQVLRDPGEPIHRLARGLRVVRPVADQCGRYRSTPPSAPVARFACSTPIPARHTNSRGVPPESIYTGVDSVNVGSLVVQPDGKILDAPPRRPHPVRPTPSCSCGSTPTARPTRVSVKTARWNCR